MVKPVDSSRALKILEAFVYENPECMNLLDDAVVDQSKHPI
jgi:hypothetical protein